MRTPRNASVLMFADIDLPLGVPHVVCRLHPDPDASAVTKQLAEVNRDLGCA
jgi:hypothetical protein